jgi:hypothetical protein
LCVAPDSGAVYESLAISSSYPAPRNDRWKEGTALADHRGLVVGIDPAQKPSPPAAGFRDRAGGPFCMRDGPAADKPIGIPSLRMTYGRLNLFLRGPNPDGVGGGMWETKAVHTAGSPRTFLPYQIGDLPVLSATPNRIMCVAAQGIPLEASASANPRNRPWA